MTNFQGVEYYNIKSLLTAEEIMVRKTIREYVGIKIIPIKKHFGYGTFPAEIIPINEITPPSAVFCYK